MLNTEQLELFKSTTGGAVFSEDRTRRFRLWRDLDERGKDGPAIMFIGLNPSTANEQENDPTIRRVMDFSRSWGYSRVWMMNLFTQVTPYPQELIVDSESERRDLFHLRFRELICHRVVFAWGAFPQAKERADKVAKLFPTAFCLGKNSDGSPKHPLYLPKSTSLITFS